MTPNPSTETAESAVSESIVDPESLRDDDGVVFEADTDVVDAETFDRVEDLADLAIVGLTNETGEVLLRKLTPDCSWKLPCRAVDPGDDYVAAANQTLVNQVGPEATLDTVIGVWSLEARTEDGTRSTTRNSVVFRATQTLDGPEPSAVAPGGEAVADADWFEQPPEGVPQLPGTDRFFD